MRTRQERRDLTRKYQARQYRIYSAHQFWSAFDNDEPTEKTIGRWKKHSAFDCGRSHCNMCCNVRRSPWSTKRERYTLQERRNYDYYWSELDDYWS